MHIRECSSGLVHVDSISPNISEFENVNNYVPFLENGCHITDSNRYAQMLPRTNTRDTNYDTFGVVVSIVEDYLIRISCTVDACRSPGNACV